jgi:hypothetical protein
MSFSYLGECCTVSPLRYPKSDEKKFWRDFYILVLKYLGFIENSKNLGIPQLFIHDQNQLPSFTFTDTEASEHSLIKVKRLPPPYDSNCFDYEKSKSFKSRGQCINDCVFKKILKK